MREGFTSWRKRAGNFFSKKFLTFRQRSAIMDDIMNELEDYSVSLPFSEQELQEILHEGKSFEWIFPTNENENVNITIHIHKED